MAMKNCCVSDAQRQKRRNHGINLFLRKERKEIRRRLTVLLLGTRNAGKTTFIKQMRIIHGQSYSDDDCKSYARLVFQTVLEGIQALCNAMANLRIKYDDPEVNQAHAKTILELVHKEVTFDEIITNAILSLWSDNGVQEAWDRRREFQISDSVKYYMNDLDRLADTNFIPTIQDILQVSEPTTGLLEYTMHMDRIVFRMVEFSGNRKLISSFEDIESILFLLDLSEFDQVTFETGENRIEESKSLFETIVTNPCFQYVHIVLLCNKTDLLEEKIHNTDLVDYFPQFVGQKNDAKAAQEFILSMFLDRNTGSREHRFIYSHFMQATNTENVDFLFQDVRDGIFQQNSRGG